MILKLKLDEVAEKEDLLGSEDKPKTSLFSSKPTMRNRSTIFTLSNRFVTIENDLEASIIIPHASQKSDQKVPKLLQTKLYLAKSFFK